MKSLKNHLSLIIPLFSIFFAIEFYVILDRVIKSYENNLRDDYTILLVANKDIKNEDVSSYVDLANLEIIDPKFMIDRLQKDDISIDIEELRTFLPKFYKVKLEHFPSSKELKSIKERLKRVDGVERVETFSKSHTKIYTLLIVLKQISKIFMGIIAIISFLLILKQIQVWYLEHKERMYIMELFGAPLWMRSGVLIRLAIIDTILSVVSVYGVFYYLLNSNILQNLIGEIYFSFDSSNLLNDSAILVVVGLFITLFSVIFVSIRQVKE
ncbi:FtsX-like permease family protein [Nitrosophilus labii]|uniref:FtsX-like permease family protein n=1 Tax=Nitrosophilus labii TaxID=2706014 RepID=UPI0016575B94|nr:FtsX-like permease family protein [Nitrosophilus labii]